MSGITEIDKGSVLFLSVWGDRLTQRVDEGTPHAIRRVYQDKDGDNVSIWELRHKHAIGNITKMFVKTRESGHQQLVVYIQKGEELAILFIPVKSRYFTTLVKKLPNFDFKEEVKIYPYDWTPAGGKRMIGIGVMQNGSKLKDYYWDDINKCHTGLPEQKKLYDDMTQEERDEMFATQTQYFIESIEILSTQIPKDELYEKSEAISVEHAGDDFLANTKEEAKPKL